MAAVVIWGVAGTWLAIVDRRTMTLPTRIIWRAAACVWILYVAAALAGAGPRGLLWAAVGAAICGGALALVHFADPPSMGFGDVRLAALNGLLCGWWGWRVALVGLGAGFILALPEAVATLVKEGPRAGRPLGPYLVAGTGGAVLWSWIRWGPMPFA